MWRNQGIHRLPKRTWFRASVVWYEAIAFTSFSVLLVHRSISLPEVFGKSRAPRTCHWQVYMYYAQLEFSLCDVFALHRILDLRSQHFLRECHVLPYLQCDFDWRLPFLKGLWSDRPDLVEVSFVSAIEQKLWMPKLPSPHG